MDPGLILIIGFLLAIAFVRLSIHAKKTHRIDPDPDKAEAAPEAPDPDNPRARPSYGAARYRTRKHRE